MDLKSLHWLKETRYKREHTIWLYQYEILVYAELIYYDWKQISGYLELGMEEGVDCKEAQETFGRDAMSYILIGTLVTQVYMAAKKLIKLHI